MTPTPPHGINSLVEGQNSGGHVTQADFVHLRVHSAYSLSEGALKIGELVELCREEAMPAVAITDTGNLFGALEFSMAAAKQGIQPIVGCQVRVDRSDSDDSGYGNGNGRHRQNGRGYDSLVLLVQNDIGYRNLLSLVSASFLESETGDPRVTLEDLEARSAGLIALTGGTSGAVGRLVAEGQLPKAVAMLERLSSAFPGRLYIELTRHGLNEERRTEAALVDLAYAHDIPLVATNDVHFADEDMYEAHDVLLCIAQGKHVGDTDRRRLTPNHRFRSAGEMRALFADLPEAVDNTLVIARRCAFMPVEHDPILPAFTDDKGASEADALRAEAEEGLRNRLEAHVFSEDMTDEERQKVAEPYWQRLDFELGVIIKMDYPGYFLIVAEFIRWAKDQGIPVGPGRGSGAGSVVAWALTITDLDPLKFGLLFERFLNPDRVSMPDFDIDFCQDRRDEVIQHVQEKYGHDRVAQIITFGKLQARAALRDVGRVLGMPYGQVDRICKLVPFNPAHPPTLAQALEQEPQLREMRAADETVDRLIDIAMRLEGLYRHASTHAAGVVIGDRPLQELLPLYRDPRSDMPATQFSMKYTELAGLVKFDFLGLKTLTVLERTLEFLAERGIELDLLNLPLDDRPTFDMLSRGDSTGVFQLESAGMRDVLRQMRPDSFEDIIALVALYRPGPMDNIPRYIACKHGREDPDYLHPKLEGILRETFGVMIYQEQVMQIAQVLSGFSLAKADLLRRAMGKKIKSEMEAQRDAFVKGAVDREVEKGTAARIFEQVDKFAGYGFNKSHAAAYALVAYQTAFLKSNYPVEFLAASMTLDMGNTEKINVFRQELQRLDIPLLPPDVNKSGVAFAVETVRNGSEKGAIRYALAAIKNVGTQAMTAVVEERKTAGAFSDVVDFARRLGNEVANKRQLENLVKAGAFDGLEKNRRRLFEGVDLLVREASSASQDRDSQQQNLFGEGGDPGAENAARLPDIGDWPKMERLGYEFDSIGFYLSEHPLTDYAVSLKRLGVKPSGDIAKTAGGTLALAGVVVQKQERTSAKGNRFAFVQLSDASGVFEVVVFADLLATSRDLLEPGSRLLIRTEARSDGDGVRLSAQSVEPLDPAVENATNGLIVYLDDDRALNGVQTVLGTSTPGRGRISVVVEVDATREVEIVLPGGFSVTGELRSVMAAAPGVLDVQEL